MTIKISHAYTDVNANSEWKSLIGSYDGIIGWLAAAWLGLLVWCYVYWLLLQSKAIISLQIQA